MRVMEEQRDKAGEEKRAQKKKLEELEAQIASMGDVGDQLAEVCRQDPFYCNVHVDCSFSLVRADLKLSYLQTGGSGVSTACGSDGTARVVAASYAGSNQEDEGSFQKVLHHGAHSAEAQSACSSSCMHARQFTHSCTGPVVQLIDNFQSIMGME